MFSLRWCVPLLLALSLLPLQAQAAKKKTTQKKSVTATQTVAATPKPDNFADEFHEALRQRDRDAVIAMLAADALLFETGYVEISRDAYIKNHFADDADFANVTDYRPLRRRVISDGQNALLLTEASIQGIFGDQRVDLVQAETMVLRRTKTNWEIVHLHWSAHSRQANDSELDAQAVPAVVAPELSPSTELKSSAELTAPVQPEAKPEDLKSP